MSDPTPTPAPVPQSGLSAWLPTILPTLLLLAYIGYNEYLKRPPAPPEPNLVAVTKAYYKTFPATFHNAAGQVRAGAINDKAGVLKVLADHAKPLATELDATFAPLVDDKGKFRSVVETHAAADALEQVAKAMGK